jgi:hypothetical protein
MSLFHITSFRNGTKFGPTMVDGLQRWTYWCLR